MKLTKLQLRQLIIEELEDIIEPEPEEEEEEQEEEEQEEQEPVDLCDMSPSAAFGYAWNKAVELLEDKYPDAAKYLTEMSGGEEEDEFSFTGDVGELGGDEAFGVGYEAGKKGL